MQEEDLNQDETLDDAIAAELGDEQQEAEQPEPEAKEPAPDVPKMYVDKESWVASGRDPTKWLPPEAFTEKTKRIDQVQELNKRLRKQQEENDKRFENVNLFHKVQLDRMRAELESRRDDAIDVADKGEVKRIDKELRDLDSLSESNKLPEPVQNNIPPEVIEWNLENQWLTPDHPLRQAVNDAYTNAINEGKTIAGALRAADRAAAQRTQAKPAEQKQPRAMVDSPKAAVGAKSQSGVSWASLTREEADTFEIWEASGTTKAEYLKIVADSRKGL
jgi:hypothetical protein